MSLGYYTQTRDSKTGEILEEVIRDLEDNDNIILDYDGRILLVIKYKEG